jgi:hypothetical protein
VVTKKAMENNNESRRETIVQGLCDVLIKNKTVSEKEAEILKKAFADSEHGHFDDFLIEEGLVEESDLLRALSQYYKVPSFDVKGYFFECTLLRKYPKDFLIRNSVIPVEREENMIIMVAGDPEAPGLASALEQHASYAVEYLVGIKKDIRDAINTYYDSSAPIDVAFEDMDMEDQERIEKEAISKDEDIDDITYGNPLYNDEDENND